MRKKIQLLFILLVSLFYKGQDNSIAASVLTPVAYQTGVPDISYPLVSLPATKDMTLNFGLSYNPNSYTAGDLTGQIARNWSLSGSNFMITRKIMGDYFDEALPSNMDWDDIYYYNLNGEQGSFKFEKTGSLPYYTYIIKKLTPTNIDIVCERNPANYTSESKQIKFFILKDSKGYKYYFQNFDTQKLPSDYDSQRPARSVFYINKIEDQSGKVVANFQNKKYIKYADNSNDTIIESWYYLPEVITTDYGKIFIEHGDSGSNYNTIDRYYFKSFTLRNQQGNFIAKCELGIYNGSYKLYDIEKFQSIEPQTIRTRYLNSFSRLDGNSNLIEKTKFTYNYIQPPSYQWGSSVPAGVYQKSNFVLNGLLNSILLPTGGKVEYNFSLHTLKLDPPLDYNSSSYVNNIQGIYTDGISPFSYKKRTDSISFDSKIKRIYPLLNIQRSPASRIYIKFLREEIYPYDTGGPTNPTLAPTPDPKLAYRVKNFSNGTNSGEIENLYSSAYVVPANGTAYLEITGSGGKGWFEIYEKFWTDPPYTIINSGISDSGVKIDSIKYYDKAQNFIPNYEHFDLKKTIRYDYTLFSEPGISSGKTVNDEEYETVIYKNIKVTESDKPGYTKYYYKTPDEYPDYTPPNITNTVWQPVYNFTKKGVLHKKEIYSSNNTRMSLQESTYLFPSYGAIPVELLSAQNVIPDNITTTSTSYDSSGNSMTETMEKTFNQDNNNLMSEKRTSADGTVSETVYQYAAEKNNTKLLGANMFSVPLEVTQKQDGVQIGKLETRYDQSGNYFPSSVQSFGINNVITGEQTNDIYDTMGNVLQTTNKAGVPTAIIWGYDRTQPIAKIEGLGYNTMLALMGQSDASGLEIVQKSNQDISSTDNTNEQLLRDALETFRKKPEFKNYLITTYTYDPLIGVKSVTSPNGFTEYYFYDNQNRLIRVEDANHNVIRENKYQQNVYTN